MNFQYTECLKFRDILESFRENWAIVFENMDVSLLDAYLARLSYGFAWKP
jgi:hypothetical protein